MTEENDNTPELGSPIADPNAPHVGPNYLPGCVIGSSIGGINDGREAIAEDLSISKYEAEILYPGFLTICIESGCLLCYKCM
jgi:hypothetical protein